MFVSVAIISGFVCGYALCSAIRGEDEHDHTTSSLLGLVTVLSFVLCVGSGFIIFLDNENYKSNYEETMKNAEWKKNQCPVYKTECGKNRYICEHKADKVGRIKLDNNTFVESYPTCE